MSTLPGLVWSNNYSLTTSNSTASTTAKAESRNQCREAEREGRKKKSGQRQKGLTWSMRVSEGKSKDEWWWGCTLPNGTWTDVNILICVLNMSLDSSLPLSRGNIQDSCLGLRPEIRGSLKDHPVSMVSTQVKTLWNPEKFGLRFFAFLKILILFFPIFY